MTRQRSRQAYDQNHSPQHALDAIAEATPTPFWLDNPRRPSPNPALVRDEVCDLCIVGGGYTGLWSAILAKEQDPAIDVIVVDKGQVGGAASGRNGGFMDASLTHGIRNGMDRHADEIEVLQKLGIENLDRIEATIARYGIDCEFERNGVIDVATSAQPASYLEGLREEYDLLRTMDNDVQ